MTKTAEVNEMLVTGLEIVLQSLREEMDDLTFRSNALAERQQSVSEHIEATKARIAALINAQENSK